MISQWTTSKLRRQMLAELTRYIASIEHLTDEQIINGHDITMDDIKAKLKHLQALAASIKSKKQD